MSKEKIALSVEEMAVELGISRPTAYELTKKKGFPAVHISERRIIIPVERLRAWLNEQAESGGAV
ncbi:MAG: helix-turn-helix domain-containing protein [Clostridia bacterium]|nr:helix-turn-helix domain-containing protein [Clostridia bacterium]